MNIDPCPFWFEDGPDRKNGEFVCSTFGFQGLRIDEALRLYLEAFRLPGEAPVIQRLLETFTDNWHVSEPCSVQWSEPPTHHLCSS